MARVAGQASRRELFLIDHLKKAEECAVTGCPCNCQPDEQQGDCDHANQRLQRKGKACTAKPQVQSESVESIDGQRLNVEFDQLDPTSAGVSCTQANSTRSMLQRAIPCNIRVCHPEGVSSVSRELGLPVTEVEWSADRPEQSTGFQQAPQAREPPIITRSALAVVWVEREPSVQTECAYC